MLIPFNPLKVAQAAAVLLKTEQGRRMSRLRLLKLLYIADRESLAERARPITGDKPVAMDHGPVLSHTYNLIKGQDFHSPQWDQFLQQAGSRDVQMVADPGVGKLTRYEIGKLQEVAARFKDANDWDIAEYTHTFEEWAKNRPGERSRNEIPLEDLLTATGRAEARDELLATARAESAFTRLISSAKR